MIIVIAYNCWGSDDCCGWRFPFRERYVLFEVNFYFDLRVDVPTTIIPVRAATVLTKVVSYSVILVRYRRPGFITTCTLSIIIVVSSSNKSAYCRFARCSIFQFFIYRKRDAFYLRISTNVVNFRLISIRFRCRKLISHFNNDSVNPPNGV